MSIIIKELFSSDPLSEALEKINFNFDQVVLSGGGPPGPPGDKGSQGIAGPKGDDGSHWFTGASTPIGPITDDFWLKPNGSVWKYSSSTWNNTGVSLLGSTGSTGISGSAMEIKIYPGRTGGLLANSNDSYLIDPLASLAVDNANFNFIVPTNSDKNSLFLGSLSLSNSKFRTWNSLDVLKGTLPSYRMIPKLTMIQNEMDLTGYGGLTIGAKGATSSIISETNPSSNSTVLGSVTNSIIDSRDFFNAGYYIKSPRTDANIYIDQTNKWFHAFLLSMYTMDLDIQAGTARGQNLHSSLGNNKIPSINLKSYRIHLEDFERNRTLYSGHRYVPAENNADSFIEINAKPSETNIYHLTGATYGKTFGYVGLQNLQNTPAAGYAHGYGSVLIGSTGNSTFSISRDIRSALNIVRPITKHYDYTNPTSMDSHITIWSGNETTADSFIGRISGVRDTSFESGNGYLQIQSRKLGFVPRLNTAIGATYFASFGFVPKFGFHVISKTNELFSGLNSTGYTGQSVPNSLIVGAIAGFNSVTGTGITADAGLAIVNYRQGPTAPTEIGINTYWAGPTPGRWAGVLGSTYVPLSNPDLYMQLGPEKDSGNVGIGFIGNPTANATQSLNIRAWSKLAIFGSVTIGATTAYHNGYTSKPANGLLIEGPLWRGNSSINSYFPMKFVGVTGPGLLGGGLTPGNHSINQFLATTPFITTLVATDRQIGILTSKDVAAEGYIALSNQSNLHDYSKQYRLNPSFSLGDFRTGMDMQMMSEGLLVVNNQKNYVIGASGGTSVAFNLDGTVAAVTAAPGITASASYKSITAAKFSNRTDFVGLTGPGFQVTTRFATQARYMSISQLEPLVKPYYGAVHRKNMPSLPGKIIDFQWEGFYLSLPTDFSVLVLDLAHYFNNTTMQYNVFAPHTYNNNNPLIAYSAGVTSNYPTMDSWLPPVVQKVNGVGGPAYGLANAPRNISTLQYTSGTNVKNVRTSNVFVTLDDGLYDGQEFTIIISRCVSANELTMVGHPIPFSLSSVWNLDDSLPNTGKLPAGQTATIYDTQKIYLGHDFVDTTTSNTYSPYTVPSGANVNDFAKWSNMTNWTAPVNNTGQAISSTTGTAPNITIFGDIKVSGLPTSKGSFKFKRGRTITFKWVKMINGSGLTTQKYQHASISADNAHYLNVTGISSPADVVTTPIPNIIQDYSKTQTAPVTGGAQYAWVEVSRTYPNSSYELDYFVLPGA